MSETRFDEQWPLTLENVAYDLAYYGTSDETERRIVKVLSQLPEQVVEFVLDKCVFLSIGHASLGQVLPARIIEKYFGESVKDRWIVLLEEEPKAESGKLYSETDAQSIVAHEVAHAWLRHDAFAEETAERELQLETEAAELTAKWGFKGKGSSAPPT